MKDTFDIPSHPIPFIPSHPIPSAKSYHLSHFLLLSLNFQNLIRVGRLHTLVARNQNLIFLFIHTFRKIGFASSAYAFSRCTICARQVLIKIFRKILKIIRKTFGKILSKVLSKILCKILCKILSKILSKILRKTLRKPILKTLRIILN